MTFTFIIFLNGGIQMLRLLLLTLLNLLGFENNQSHPQTLQKQTQTPIVNKDLLLLILVGVVFVSMIVLVFLFVPGTESGAVRNGLQNI